MPSGSRVTVINNPASPGEIENSLASNGNSGCGVYNVQNATKVAHMAIIKFREKNNE